MLLKYSLTIWQCILFGMLFCDAYVFLIDREALKVSNHFAFVLIISIKEMPWMM